MYTRTFRRILREIPERRMLSRYSENGRCLSSFISGNQVLFRSRALSRTTRLSRPIQSQPARKLVHVAGVDRKCVRPLVSLMCTEHDQRSDAPARPEELIHNSSRLRMPETPGVTGMLASHGQGSFYAANAACSAGKQGVVPQRRTSQLSHTGRKP